MKIKKLTIGYVIQTFDTETRKFLSQEFVAGEVEYENENGENIEPHLMENADGSEPYLPFDMVQPFDWKKEAGREITKRLANIA